MSFVQQLEGRHGPALLLVMAALVLEIPMALAASVSTPEERVIAFITDYLRAHERSGKPSEDVAGDIQRWEQEVEKLDAAHFVGGGGRELATVMSGSPTFHTDRDKIIRNTRSGDLVWVETLAPDGKLSRFHEFELRPIGDDWRIARIRRYLQPLNAPFMTERERLRFENPKTHPLRALPEAEAGFDGRALFDHGKRVQAGEDFTRIEVRRVGALNAASGVLVVGDLAYDPWPLAPVGQRVPPGRYDVDVSIAFERIAAVRVVISKNTAVSWHPADMGDGGHGTGVDAGNISVSDASALLAVNYRFKDRLMEQHAEMTGHTNALMLSLVNPDDAVVADSGYGDGVYPVYWGVDANGGIAQLVIDLLVLPGSRTNSNP